MLPRGRSSDAPARNGAAPPAAHGWIGRRRRMQCEPGPLKTRGVLVADLFCGAGGSSSGARRALESLGFQMNLVAVNHWNIAIETHSRNHPEARHYCQDLNAVKPAEVVPEGNVFLWAREALRRFARGKMPDPHSSDLPLSPRAWFLPPLPLRAAAARTRVSRSNCLSPGSRPTADCRRAFRWAAPARAAPA